ncbi:PREDICTED: uncharacterized protein LOC104591760 [Nelumbo nucifera]|uniref:Uncharacterized protein LOC104591760 n=1 Tax=Nelumbo nucifera TaxID=4432 RepID=A0A1U7Z973_NELNU|nr:PREDICTED: uncharacterized protein LOC104591760 [Nelumbo nucifera]XP_010249070.1 PREDICTED: uncharacterized protein LOC104591760 [Nelumbo nucifera]
MSLPLGKLTILVGAGVLGSVLAKEGRIADVSDLFSGAFKIVWKQLKRDDSPMSRVSRAKPQNDSLLAQVNSLREELQLLASNRSVTIVTGSASGSKFYGVPVVLVVVVGYGYMWWKGWKLSDMMFATRRSLSDACTTVAKQLEQVSSSITAAKRHLSSRIDRVDSNLDECAEITAATREEVSQLQGDLKMLGVDVESVHRVVQTLEIKIGRIEGKQDLTNEGVKRLCNFVWNLENSRPTDRIQASSSSSSRLPFELPQITPTSRTESLPAKVLSLEPPSPPASNESPKLSRPLQNAVPASGLKELQGISDSTTSSIQPEVPNATRVSEDKSNCSSSSRQSGWKLPSLNASFLTRTRSATYSFK